MSASPSALATDCLGHAYAGGRGQVLRDVTASFAWSTMTAIWGPSGSGKSTLLSLLGLLMRPTTGSVLMEGIDPWAGTAAVRRARRGQFAWVLQNNACLEARTALGNVMVGPLSDGATWQEATETAVAALSVVGLERLAESRASELSGGELQRMTVARALAQAHPVVLADEPTGQLDHTSSLVVARALRQLAEAGRAVVVATHDAAVADACDVVWTIEDGRLSAGR